MAMLKCKMCGGDLVLNEESTVAECEYCCGELKGMFTKKCVNCGKPKDY